MNSSRRNMRNVTHINILQHRYCSTFVSLSKSSYQLLLSAYFLSFRLQIPQDNFFEELELPWIPKKIVKELQQLRPNQLYQLPFWYPNKGLGASLNFPKGLELMGFLLSRTLFIPFSLGRFLSSFLPLFLSLFLFAVDLVPFYLFIFLLPLLFHFHRLNHLLCISFSLQLFFLFLAPSTHLSLSLCEYFFLLSISLPSFLFHSLSVFF